MMESTTLPDIHTVHDNNQTETPKSSTIINHLSLSICVFGVVCNTLAFCLMLRREARKMSTSVYLLSLAVYDNIYLVMSVILTLEQEYQFHVTTINSITCKVNMFLVSWAPYCSVWVLVAVTIERLIVIYYPHR